MLGVLFASVSAWPLVGSYTLARLTRAWGAPSLETALFVVHVWPFVLYFEHRYQARPSDW